MPLWGKKPDENTPPPNSEQDKAEIDQLVERLGASFEEKLKPIREKVDGVVTKFEAIERAAYEPPPNDDPPVEPEVGSDDWKKKNLGPLAVQNALLSARLTEREILDAVPAEWRDVVIPRVRELLDKQTPIQKKAAPDYANYVQNCVDLVIGQEAKKSGLHRDPTSKRFFIEDATGGSTGSSPLLDKSLEWVDRKGRVHSAEETLRKLSIDPETFVKSNEVM